MKIRNSIYILAVGAFLVSCNDLDVDDSVDFNVSLASDNTYEAGDPVVFNFDGNPDYTINSCATSRCFFGQFNMDSEIVQDQNVRKAIEMGIDKEGFCSVIMEGRGIPAKGAFPGSFSYGNDAVETVSYDPEEAKKLADAFWPGPLTMIVRKNDKVPYETTGGMDTVAVRMPNHPVALELIRRSGGYIAAPSANTSGKPSPTLAEHVAFDMDGRIPMILDGGPVGIGIESTIVDLTEEIPMILRPGYITPKMLEKVIGEVKMDPGIIASDSLQKPKAPGMKYKHYAPKADLILVDGEEEKVVAKINALAKEAVLLGKKVGIIGTDETIDRYPEGEVVSIGARSDEDAIAKHLYKLLRDFDEKEVDIIYSESFATPRIGQAIMNRLLKAAGHQVITV